MLVGSLIGTVLDWFNNLPEGSMTSLEVFVRLLVAHFAANKTKPPDTTNLFYVRQVKGEAVKQYLRCFNKVVVQISQPNKGMCVKAFIIGSRSGLFRESLVKKRPANMADINLRAVSYVKVEEFARKKKEEERRGEDGLRSKAEKRGRLASGSGGLLKTRREEKSGGGSYGGRTGGGSYTNREEKPYERIEERTWFPPKLPISQRDIVKDVNTTRLLRFPEKATMNMGKNSSAWCCFHKACGHDTERCYTLARQIDDLMQRGMLQIAGMKEVKEKESEEKREREEKRMGKRKKDMKAQYWEI